MSRRRMKLCIISIHPSICSSFIHLLRRTSLLEEFTYEVPRRHPSQMSPQLPPFNVEDEQLDCESIPNDWTSHPISKGESSHPLVEAHFCHLYPQSQSFGHESKLVAIGESRNTDLTGAFTLSSLFTTLVHATEDAALIHMSSSCFPLTSQDPKIT